MAASDEFANQAAQLALKSLEEDLIAASRSYEDAIRYDDPVTAADALKSYATVRQSYDALTVGQQQQPGQLSNAQVNFLSRRQAGGDTLDAQRMGDYARAHDRALAGGLRPDTREYFSAIEHYVDHLGDGRQKPLDEAEVASMCGISQQEYAAQAARLRAMKRNGSYGGDR